MTFRTGPELSNFFRIHYRGGISQDFFSGLYRLISETEDPKRAASLRSLAQTLADLLETEIREGLSDQRRINAIEIAFGALVPDGATLFFSDPRSMEEACRLHRCLLAPGIADRRRLFDSESPFRMIFAAGLLALARLHCDCPGADAAGPDAPLTRRGSARRLLDGLVEIASQTRFSGSMAEDLLRLNQTARTPAPYAA